MTVRRVPKGCNGKADRAKGRYTREELSHRPKAPRPLLSPVGGLFFFLLLFRGSRDLHATVVAEPIVVVRQKVVQKFTVHDDLLSVY